MRPRAYIETSIPSYYHERRTTPIIVAMREWTREWWPLAPERYELFSSYAVLREILVGPDHRQREWLEFIRGIPLLPVDRTVLEIAETYI